MSRTYTRADLPPLLALIAFAHLLRILLIPEFLGGWRSIIYGSMVGMMITKES